MKPILFIFNGVIKSNNNISISGGDIRLFEVIKCTDKKKVYLLTTSNGVLLAEKFGVPYHKRYVIDYVVDSGIWSNFIISLKSFFNLPKDLNFFQNGIVYSSCEHLYDVLPALRMKFLNGCQWYAVYHQVVDYPWKDKRGGTSAYIRYVYWLNIFISGLLIKMFANKILAVSDQTTKKLQVIKKIDSSRISTVYCGVDYSEITAIVKKYKHEKGSMYEAVFVGRLNYNKGAFELLDIWRLVCQKRPKAKLAIIGDGGKEIIEKMKNIIEEYNMQQNITLFGPIFDVEEKFRVLNGSKLFVYPSFQENWGIVIGEAMASGISVISHKIEEIQSIWSDNIEWIEIGATASFADMINVYLDDGNRRMALSRKALEFIKKYDWKEVIKNEFS